MKGRKREREKKRNEKKKKGRRMNDSNCDSFRGGEGMPGRGIRVEGLQELGN